MRISSENLSCPNIWTIKGEKQHRFSCGSQNTSLSFQKAQGRRIPIPYLADGQMKKGQCQDVGGRERIGGYLLELLEQKGNHGPKN